MQIKIIGTLFIATVFATGCAATLRPAGSMQNSLANIRAAEELGAEKVPQAKLHLQLAQEQADQAKALIEKEENEKAGYVLLRSEADSELAIALAHESAARAEAKLAIEKLKVVNP